MDRSRSSRMLIFALVLAAFLLMLNTGCVLLERKLLFFPTHDTRTNGLPSWRDSEDVIGFAREVNQPKAIWLMLHGNGGQAADRAYAIQAFASDDSIYILEYPGYGARMGKPSKESFNLAAQQAYLLLRKQYPSRPVCVVSESIGSGAASYLASLPEPPNKLVLIAPFDRLRRVAQEHFPSWLVALLLRDDWNNVELLANYRGPVEIYGAANDEVIPVSHARALAAAIPQAKFTLITGVHNDWSHGDQVRIRYE